MERGCEKSSLIVEIQDSNGCHATIRQGSLAFREKTNLDHELAKLRLSRDICKLQQERKIYRNFEIKKETALHTCHHRRHIHDSRWN